MGNNLTANPNLGCARIIKFSIVGHIKRTREKIKKNKTVEYKVIVSRSDLIECLSDPIPCRMRASPGNIHTDGIQEEYLNIFEYSCH